MQELFGFIRDLARACQARGIEFLVSSEFDSPARVPRGEG